MYEALVAPLMSVNVPVEVVALAHCHVVLATPPSGSLRMAVRATPTKGVSESKLTVPASSTSVTVISKSKVSSISVSALPSRSFLSLTLIVIS